MSPIFFSEKKSFRPSSLNIKIITLPPLDAANFELKIKINNKKKDFALADSVEVRFYCTVAIIKLFLALQRLKVILITA